MDLVNDRTLAALGVALFFMGIAASSMSGNGLPILSAAFLIAFAVPSYYYFLTHLPVRRALPVLIFFSVFPIAAEFVGVTTGLPYGAFHYTDGMGYRLGGIVPWSVAFVFAPLVLGSMRLASWVTTDARLAIPTSSLILVIHDMVLDPAAVYGGYWIWAREGAYYGVPAGNFIGWLLVGLLASTIMHLLTAGVQTRLWRLPPGTEISLFEITCFWAGFSALSGMLLPAGIGLGLACFAFLCLRASGGRPLRSRL
jgi:putative membrane protein